MPYAMMAANGVVYLTYGVLTDNFTLKIANVTAIVMGLGYCGVFWRHRSPTAVVAPFFGSASLIAGATVSVATLLPVSDAQNIIGLTGCGLCVAM